MRKTPLHAAHAALGARFVPFAGFEMPVQYTGIVDETNCVRSAVGLFDLCHMGRLEIHGPDREALVDAVFSATFTKLRHGRAKYGFLLNEEGYPIDDVLVYRDTDVVHIVINAGGREADPAWVAKVRSDRGLDCEIRDLSDAQAMIALQGPHSEHALQPLCSADLSAVRYYGFVNTQVLGTPTLLARTGYTGEDGFELFFDKSKAVEVWEALLASGKSLGIQAIGLGARDILRLEAGMPLYGHELSTSIHPLEADLAFGVNLKKAETVGIPALGALAEAGLQREALSLASTGGRPAREGHTVHLGDEEIGIVTSGGPSPTTGQNIARVLVTAGKASVGDTLEIEVRGKRHPMGVVPAPFYKRPKKSAAAS